MADAETIELVRRRRAAKLAAQPAPTEAPKGLRPQPAGALEEKPSAAGSFFRGLYQGAAQGFGDELIGTTGAIMRPLMGRAAGVDPSFQDEFGDAYKEERNRARSDFDADAKENPLAFGGGQLAGAVAVPLPALKGATLAGKIGKGALIGAASGAAQGAGAASELSDIPEEAAIGAGAGGALGAVFPAIGAGAGAIRRAATSPAVREKAAAGLDAMGGEGVIAAVRKGALKRAAGAVRGAPDAPPAPSGLPDWMTSVADDAASAQPGTATRELDALKRAMAAADAPSPLSRTTKPVDMSQVMGAGDTVPLPTGGGGNNAAYDEYVRGLRATAASQAEKTAGIRAPKAPDALARARARAVPESPSAFDLPPIPEPSTAAIRGDRAAPTSEVWEGWNAAAHDPTWKPPTNWPGIPEEELAPQFAGGRMRQWWEVGPETKMGARNDFRRSRDPGATQEIRPGALDALKAISRKSSPAPAAVSPAAQSRSPIPAGGARTPTEQSFLLEDFRASMATGDPQAVSMALQKASMMGVPRDEAMAIAKQAGWSPEWRKWAGLAEPGEDLPITRMMGLGNSPEQIAKATGLPLDIVRKRGGGSSAIKKKAQ